MKTLYVVIGRIDGKIAVHGWWKNPFNHEQLFSLFTRGDVRFMTCVHENCKYISLDSVRAILSSYYEFLELKGII